MPGGPRSVTTRSPASIAATTRARSASRPKSARAGGSPVVTGVGEATDPRFSWMDTSIAPEREAGADFNRF